MTPNHLWVIVPSFQVRCHSTVALAFECESGRVIVDHGFLSDGESLIIDILLPRDDTNYQGADDVKGHLAVMLRPQPFHLDQVVAAKEELRDVSAIVVGQVEFATRVEPLVPIQVKHKVVKNDELFSILHLLINFFRGEGLNLAAFASLYLWSIDFTARVIVAKAINRLKNDH